MSGGKLPVIEIEMLTLKKDGRGLYAYDDDDVVTIGGAFTFPSASAVVGSLKLTTYSGSTTQVGYIPVYSSA